MKILLSLMFFSVFACAQQDVTNVSYAAYSTDGGTEIVVSIKSGIPIPNSTGFVVQLQWGGLIQSETITRIARRDKADTESNQIPTRVKFFLPETQDWVKVTRLMVIPFNWARTYLAMPGTGVLPE